MNVALVCHTNFAGNSGIQMFHLANALVDAGCNCVCIVPKEKETVSGCGASKFVTYDFDQAITEELIFADGGPPSLIHAWTPREMVRTVSERLARRYRCPIIVHLEDNEDLVTASYLGIDIEELLSLPLDELDRRVPSFLSHPHRSRSFVKQAAGVTVLIEKLRDAVPEGKHVRMFWPSCEGTLFHPMAADTNLRNRLGITDAEIVLTYHGNVHQVNRAEMRSLYLSVLFLNRAGFPARLIRLGTDSVDCLENARDEVMPHVIDLGLMAHREIPQFLALATVLVQPGRSDPYNDFRFPSKIPEFLAMQKPVILPNTNIGLHMNDGEDCLLLHMGHAGEIVDRILRLASNPVLADRIAKGGRRFFEQHLSWEKAARQVMSFYKDIIGSQDRSVAQEAAPGVSRTDDRLPAR